MQTVLFIGLVWPEPQSSAAGTRIVQLIKLFLNAKYDVVFASAAAKTPYSYPLADLAVEEVGIQLNDHMFDQFVQQLQPAIVVYDRFMIEEQYGWRVREFAPQALTILDTEDLHFLRAARQEAEKKKRPIDLYSATAKREIASILRSDLSLIIAQHELTLLKEQFNIPATLLYYLPFLEEAVDTQQKQDWPTFDQRRDLMFIGNFLHEPNWHTVQVLKNEIWPLLKVKLPEAELHIYGAYASQKVYQLHQPKDRFFIKDRADDARKTMENYRLLLAPIAFGAGAKGKIIDSMQSGTPNVCSSITAESMRKDERWNGFIADSAVDFVEKTVQLYRDDKLWLAAQETGIQLLSENYQGTDFVEPFLAGISQLSSNLLAHRKANFLGEILHSQQLSSTKYMSLWIAEKNKK